MPERGHVRYLQLDQLDKARQTIVIERKYSMQEYSSAVETAVKNFLGLKCLLIRNVS